MVLLTLRSCEMSGWSDIVYMPATTAAPKNGIFGGGDVIMVPVFFQAPKTEQ